MVVEEILVHVAGPCSRQDDQKSRELAMHYHNFEAKSYHVMTGHSTNKDSSTGKRISHDAQRSQEAESPVFLQDWSHVSSDDIIVPRTINFTRTVHLEPMSHTSSDYIQETPAATQALESQLLTSSIDASLSSQARLNWQAGDVVFTSSPRNDVVSARANEISCKNEVLSKDTDSSVSQPTEKATVDPGPATEALFSPLRFSEGDGILSSQPQHQHLEIQAPTPRISTEKAPISFVTSSLQSLADIPGLKPHFRPFQTLREILPQERGHWYVDTSIWDQSVRNECWQYLNAFVGGGRAGWGVSCHLSTNDTVPSHATGDAQASSRHAEHMRFHCWGEIVRHVYLLIFVASRSRVKHSAAKWLDAAENVVVVMPLQDPL